MHELVGVSVEDLWALPDDLLLQEVISKPDVLHHGLVHIDFVRGWLVLW